MSCPCLFDRFLETETEFVIEPAYRTPVESVSISVSTCLYGGRQIIFAKRPLICSKEKRERELHNHHHHPNWNAVPENEDPDGAEDRIFFFFFVLCPVFVSSVSFL